MATIPHTPCPHRTGPHPFSPASRPGRDQGPDSSLLEGYGGLVAMALLLFVTAWMLAGPPGIVVASAAVATLVLLTPRIPAGLPLRLRGALPLAPWHAPGLRAEVERLARAAGLPRPPRLYLRPIGMIEAVSSGTGKDGALSLSDGALNRLDPGALRAVIAHELAHIRNGDTRVLMLGGTMSMVITATAFTGLALALIGTLLTGQRALPLWAAMLLAAAPSLASLALLALSRQREFAADATAARLTGDPLALCRALQLLERESAGLLSAWLPLPGRADREQGTGRIPRWLRTHPPTQERIARLTDLHRQASLRTPADWSMIDPAAGTRRWPRR